MTKDLVSQIVTATRIKETGLRVTLSRIKRRHDLRSIEQAACFYIKKKRLPINVSSMIDDRTKSAVQTLLAPKQPPHLAARSSLTPKKSKTLFAPKVKWLNPRLYTVAENMADFYGYLFLFENSLRSKVQDVMAQSNPKWWDDKIRLELPKVHAYAEGERAKQAKLPMVGSPGVLKPLDFLTVGHLEEIIVKYQSRFVPSLFPNLHFFTGHMVIVKRVRNGVAHMSPAIRLKDISNARHEIDILLQHFASK